MAPAIKMATSAIIVDTREDAVLAHMNYENVVREQITVGDYAIKIDDRVIAIFERKSLADYGSSILDGRMKNKMKMISARELSESQGQTLHLYYIVEGDMYPGDNTEYGGVKYSSIKSSIRHLMTEYGIMIIRTRNAAETARELYEMFCSYQVRPPKTVETTSVEGRYELTDRDLLHARHELTKQDRKIEMLKSLPGIGKETAVKMSSKSIASYIHDPMTAGNAKIVASFVALRQPEWNHVQKTFVGAVPGIGKKTVIVTQNKHSSFTALVQSIRDRKESELLAWEKTLLDLLK